jgi:hypothetical protein
MPSKASPPSLLPIYDVRLCVGPGHWPVARRGLGPLDAYRAASLLAKRYRSSVAVVPAGTRPPYVRREDIPAPVLRALAARASAQGGKASPDECRAACATPPPSFDQLFPRPAAAPAPAPARPLPRAVALPAALPVALPAALPVARRLPSPPPPPVVGPAPAAAPPVIVPRAPSSRAGLVGHVRAQIRSLRRLLVELQPAYGCTSEHVL